MTPMEIFEVHKSKLRRVPNNGRAKKGDDIWPIEEAPTRILEEVFKKSSISIDKQRNIAFSDVTAYLKQVLRRVFNNEVRQEGMRYLAN